jgi:hypothetical protein
MSGRLRILIELCLGMAAMLTALASDVFLLSVFRSHVKQVLLAPGYRPVYLRSGRRNRVR